MVHSDVSVIQVQRGVQVDIDDIKEWTVAILLFPFIILLLFMFFFIFCYPNDGCNSSRLVDSNTIREEKWKQKQKDSY